MPNYFYTLIVSLALVIACILMYFLFGKLTAQDRTAIFQKHQTLQHDGLTRKYRYYSPDQDKKLPLVIMIHGYRFDSGVRMELYSGMSNLAAESKEFNVVYPEGIEKSWNGDICCGTAQGQNIDDSGFTEKLIDKLTKEENIDTMKIYVVGFSNGGFLAQKLLNDLPDRLAGGAIIMSSIGEQGGIKIDIANATAPVLIVNGEQDTYTNHSLPRDGFRFMTHNQTVSAWTSQLAAKSSKRSGITTTHQDENNKTVVSSRLYDTKHVWPGWRLWNFTEPIPEFTKDVWQILKSYR